MTSQKRSYQYARPMVVSSLEAQATAQTLTRVQLAPGNKGLGANYDEAWLQRLLHRHADSLPVAEIEPGFGRIIAVGMELPTPAGFVDNLFVTPEGNLVVVECKLWQNPGARRRVLAQIIDYAQSMLKWRYEDFDKAIGRSVGTDGRPVAKSLIDVIREATGDPDSVDEPSFIDAVQKNLRLGRMLLLVVGDGIHEGTESLADYLQQHAGFHFTLGLVETAIYVLPSGGYLVQPRVLARTLNIERGVVTIETGSGDTRPVVVAQPHTDQNARAMSLTEETFFQKLEEIDPRAASALKKFLEMERTRGLGVFLDVGARSGMLRWESPQGKLYSLGGINLHGQLTTYSVGWVPNLIGHVGLGPDYLDDLSKLIGGQVKKTPKQEQWYVVKGGMTTLPRAIDALDRADEWLDYIARFQKRISDAEGVE